MGGAGGGTDRGTSKGKHPNWLAACGGSGREVLLDASLPIVGDGGVEDHLVLEWALMNLVVC